MAWMTDAFTRNKIDSPRLCAEGLLSHVVNCDRLKLYTDPERPATAEELASLRLLVGRALKHEPIQYLTGEAWFFGLPMTVDRRVLIPRFCTETIVEELLQLLRQRQASGLAEESAGEFTFADVCTGSGCIATALLKNLPKARAIATDLSREALEVAAINAARHRVDERLELLEGSLLAPLAERIPSASCEGLDALVSNPPYIPDHEWPDVPPNVREHEPTLALRGGREGVDFVGPLITEAPGLLKPGGILMIEIAACTAKAVLALAQAHPRLKECRIVRDSDALERVLVAQRA